MSKLFEYYIPTVGAKGVYALLSPFSTLEGEVYECIAVDTIASLIANNDDPFAEIYQTAGLTQDQFKADASENMQIITLRNDTGYCLKIPAKYLAGYPVQDGIFYRSLSVSVFLPAMPITQDVTGLKTDLEDLVRTNLGVSARVSFVETSRLKMVSVATHEATQTARELVKSQNSTLYGQIAELQARVDYLTSRNQALEQFLINNPITP